MVNLLEIELYRNHMEWNFTQGEKNFVIYGGNFIQKLVENNPHVSRLPS